jgi:hypothetical protein
MDGCGSAGLRSVPERQEKLAMQTRLFTLCPVSRSPCISVPSFIQRMAKAVKRVSSEALAALRAGGKGRASDAWSNRQRQLTQRWFAGHMGSLSVRYPAELITWQSPRLSRPCRWMKRHSGSAYRPGDGHAAVFPSGNSKQQEPASLAQCGRKKLEEARVSFSAHEPCGWTRGSLSAGWWLDSSG